MFILCNPVVTLQYTKNMSGDYLLSAKTSVNLVKAAYIHYLKIQQHL